MPLKFINFCYDFVLFFASSPMRSRNSSTIRRHFYACPMLTFVNAVSTH